MHKVTLLKAQDVVKSESPLLLRRLQERPIVGDPTASGHMTVVTTQGREPEMNDQQEDATRYDRD